MAEQIADLTHLRDEINRLAVNLGKSDGVFITPLADIPRFTCHEAGFLRLVSWLYVLYRESGRVSVPFLVDQLDSYDLDRDGRCRDHPDTVNCLRTMLQHGLDERDQRDLQLLLSASHWLAGECGKEYPENQEDWERCLRALLRDSYEFLASLKECLQQIAAGEFHVGIVREWSYRCTRSRPPHEFDQLISLIASDFGMDQLEPAAFRKRHYDAWSKELEVLNFTHDFEIEARKLIERDLFRFPVLPITATDIMSEFGLSPGPSVGEYRRRAETIYTEKPCSRLELLERLRSAIGATSFPVLLRDRSGE